MVADCREISVLAEETIALAEEATSIGESNVLDIYFDNRNREKLIESRCANPDHDDEFKLENIRHPLKIWTSGEQLARAVISAMEYRGPHPVVNYETCIGCQACIRACPHNALCSIYNEELHKYHAVVLNAKDCRDDMGCIRECFYDSIAMVNTQKEIPLVKKPARKSAMGGYEAEHAEGIYLVGDVSKAPFIKNAVEEGCNAADKIGDDFDSNGRAEGADLDLAIIGAGPAGISTAVRANKRNLSYVVLERGVTCSTIVEKYQDGKIVSINQKKDTGELQSEIRFSGPSVKKEEMLAWLNDAIKENSIKINEFEACHEIGKENGYFLVKTEKNREGYKVRRVVVAIGNAGAPQKLRPGKDDPDAGKATRWQELERRGRILYALKDADLYKDHKIVVVGGGNSAIEVAVDLVGKRQNDGTVRFHTVGANQVTLVIRSDFAKDLTIENKIWIYYCIDHGRIKPYFDTSIVDINDHEIVLASGAGKERIISTVQYDNIFGMIGSIAPEGFLRGLGIKYTID